MNGDEAEAGQSDPEHEKRHQQPACPHASRRHERAGGGGEDADRSEGKKNYPRGAGELDGTPFGTLTPRRGSG
jgi:hypothetical protein